MIKPVHPFEGGVFLRFQVALRSSLVDEFGFVQSAHRTEWTGIARVQGVVTTLLLV